jgi:hypothetical protein
MKSQSGWTSRKSLAWLVAALLCCGALTTAQERAADEGPPKMRLRLPAYFSRVVDDMQREEIYGILRACEEKLIPLRDQIQALEDQRDADVREVLTDEQRAEVDRLTEEARQRRVDRRTASETTPADESKTDSAGGASGRSGRSKR